MEDNAVSGNRPRVVTAAAENDGGNLQLDKLTDGIPERDVGQLH